MPSDLKYPDGPDDKEAILAYANNAHRAARSYRIEVERAAQRNVLYYLGVQWIKYDHAIRLWRPIAVGKRTPRPMTNRIAPLVNQAVANLMNFKPPTTYSPASDKPEDIAAATVADRINSIVEREAKIDSMKPLIAHWLITTGNVFLINNYDTGPDSGVDFIQSEQCMQCGAVSTPVQIVQAAEMKGMKPGAPVCPNCGAVGALQPATKDSVAQSPQVPGQIEGSRNASELDVRGAAGQPGVGPVQPTPPAAANPAYATDRSNATPGAALPITPPGMPPGHTLGPENAVGVAYPKGRFMTEVENVFTCFFDNASGPTIYDSSYFLNVRHRNKDWITRMYGADVAGRVSYNQPTEPYSGLFESLSYATTLWSYGYGTPSSLSEPRARVRRLWFRPRPGVAPEGIYAEIVDEEVVRSGPWPYKDETGQPLLNIVHIGMDPVPGRVLYKSRVDDIVPKQDQRNRLESIMELHSIRMANSVWLVPEGVGLSKMSGEQGQIVKYNALANVPPPSRMPGDTISPYIPQWIAQIDSEMDAIFGTYEVGRGEAPRGVSAYSALQLLDERQQQGQSSIMRNWALGWVEWSKQNLHIWRQYATDDRYLTTGGGQWSIQKFNKAALTGGVNITAETGSFRPQTMLAKRALFEQLIRVGMVNPNDPLQRYEVATAMGGSDIMPDFKADMEYAARLIDKLTSGGAPPPPNPWENMPLMLSVFRRFMLSEQFEALNPIIQQRITAYAEIYHQLIIEQMQAMPQRGPGQIAPGPGGPKGAKPSGGGLPGGSEQRQAQQDSQAAAPPQPGEGG